MNTKLLGCLAAIATAAAIVVATPALAQHGGGSMSGGSMHFGGGMPGGRMFTGRSVFVPGANRFVGAPFAGRHAFANRRFFDEGVASATGVFSSIDSITSRSLAYRSLTTTRPTGMGAGVEYGLRTAGNGATFAMITATVMAISSYS